MGAWKSAQPHQYQIHENLNNGNLNCEIALTPVKIPILKKTKDNSGSEDLEKRKSLYNVDGNVI